ncbi:ATP-binding cassette domain-containing protein [Aureispira sp. CCB-E]|uniref:sulfate/molybdate ABC transporter ATP-binding protein n=1 Tax=Aureispira sp. CCB-E TaxID=3051121 RepID=UPI002868DE0B|nr:ATP-binding cassette domain-containing protein [Aureispira sp. CCB-E]WMX16772.1 ATP-binding cassette domain-containing protein [Aureispira sp. CCB-E]
MLLKIALEKRITPTRRLQVDLELERGDFVAIYGKSGIGKTTLLRMIAGLSQADSGMLSVGQKTWFDSKKNINLPPQNRKVGFVFQDYALFPNMTVAENLQFANNNPALIQKLLQQTNLAPLKNKKPNHLSGGQQQRVALARALMVESSILLLDEPLSALDYGLRREMQHLIADLHVQYQRTTLMVSHDVPEIINLANKLLVIDDNKVALYRNPKLYFEEQELLDEVLEEGVVLEINENELLLRIGEKRRKLPYLKGDLKNINVGDTLTVKRWVLPSDMYKIEPK